MPIPDFADGVDLPIGIHRATLDEVNARFGGDTLRRMTATANLNRIHDLALATGRLLHFVIFGSYVTGKSEPNDVDVVMIMAEEFKTADCNEASARLFNNRDAAEYYGASVFWTKPSAMLGESAEDFLAGWQIKRDRGQRGIVEVT